MWNTWKGCTCIYIIVPRSIEQAVQKEGSENKKPLLYYWCVTGYSIWIAVINELQLKSSAICTSCKTGRNSKKILPLQQKKGHPVLSTVMTLICLKSSLISWTVKENLKVLPSKIKHSNTIDILSGLKYIWKTRVMFQGFKFNDFGFPLS